MIMLTAELSSDAAMREISCHSDNPENTSDNFFFFFRNRNRVERGKKLELLFL